MAVKQVLLGFGVSGFGFPESDLRASCPVSVASVEIIGRWTKSVK
jgi:hypothetical protein